MSNYSLQNKIKDLSIEEIRILNNHPPIRKDQWSDNIYDSIKQRIKKDLLLGQYDRCAYCRKIIEADGKYEPLEHIIAKSIKAEWMFLPNNLIVTCDSCNNLKGSTTVLTEEYKSAQEFPSVSKAYLIFNPHYDKWEDHLYYEDGIFLVPVPDSKGQNTIRICKLYRYNVVINRAKELKLLQKTPLSRISNRILNLDKSSPLYSELVEELVRAINYYVDRVNDNPNF